MDEDKRLTLEEVGKLTVPQRSTQTVRLWCKTRDLPYTKDGVSGTMLISRYALKKWCHAHGVALED